MKKCDIINHRNQKEEIDKKMNAMISQLQKLPKFQEYIEEINKHSPVISISGLSDVGKVQYLYATKEATNRPICIVTYNEIQAKKIIEDLNYFTKDFETIYYFPKKEIASYDYVLESKDVFYQRIEVFNKIEQKKAKIIVSKIYVISTQIGNENGKNILFGRSKANSYSVRV